jgi:hypothetical protein
MDLDAAEAGGHCIARGLLEGGDDAQDFGGL